MVTGTDVDYGALTHMLVAALDKQPNFSLHYQQEVVDIEKTSDGRWAVEVKNLKTDEKNRVSAKFVFVRAGGKALELL